MAKKKVVDTTEKKERRIAYFSSKKDESGKPVLERPTKFPIRGWIVEKDMKLKGQEPKSYNNVSEIITEAKAIPGNNNIYFFAAAPLAYDVL